MAATASNVTDRATFDPVPSDMLSKALDATCQALGILPGEHHEREVIAVEDR